MTSYESTNLAGTHAQIADSGSGETSLRVNEVGDRSPNTVIGSHPRDQLHTSEHSVPSNTSTQFGSLGQRYHDPQSTGGWGEPQSNPGGNASDSRLAQTGHPSSANALPGSDGSTHYTEKSLPPGQTGHSGTEGTLDGMSNPVHGVGSGARTHATPDSANEASVHMKKPSDVADLRNDGEDGQSRGANAERDHGLDPEHDHISDYTKKATAKDKLVGTLTQVAGSVTGNTEKKEEGKLRKIGELVPDDK